jgi:hypothetical protein
MTTFTQASTQLNVTGLQLLALMRNPQFPTATSGNGLSSAKASGINIFASLWSATIANWWKVSTAALATFNFACAAAHSPGPYYRPAYSDPLFDI